MALSAKFSCGNQPVQSDYIRRYSVRTTVFLAGFVNVVERIDDLPLEFGVNVIFVPVEILQILYPFEITDDYAAAVA